MKKIGFLGAYDKANFIIHIAKILELMNYNVLVVDATLMQKIKYIIPSISPTKSYITDFEGIDFAIGFENWFDIEKYLGIRYDVDEQGKINSRKNENKIFYDFILIDVDSSEKFDSFLMKNADENYFITAFDAYSLKKGMRIFENLKYSIEVKKILFSYNIIKEEEAYLDRLSSEYNVIWNDYVIYFPIMVEDLVVMMENEITQKIKFRRLSMEYKESLSFVIQDICKERNIGNIKKLMKD